MESQRLLGGFETLLLLAVVRRGKRAYGVTIREELLQRAGKDVAVGAIYTGLERLEQKGYVESWTGEPTKARGGRSKRFYKLTARGLGALNETRDAIQNLADGLNLKDVYA
jgi:DNA-binding PadR family transcriptional regulator